MSGRGVIVSTLATLAALGAPRAETLRPRGQAGRRAAHPHRAAPPRSAAPGGSLRECWRSPLPAGPRSSGGVTSGDLDGDGRAEVIASHGEDAVVLDATGRRVRTLPLARETTLLA